jgi:hypothetical protein
LTGRLRRIGNGDLFGGVKVEKQELGMKLNEEISGERNG